MVEGWQQEESAANESRPASLAGDTELARRSAGLNLQDRTGPQPVIEDTSKRKREQEEPGGSDEVMRDAEEGLESSRMEAEHVVDDKETQSQAPAQSIADCQLDGEHAEPPALLSASSHSEDSVGEDELEENSDYSDEVASTDIDGEDEDEDEDDDDDEYGDEDAEGEDGHDIFLSLDERQEHEHVMQMLGLNQAAEGLRANFVARPARSSGRRSVWNRNSSMWRGPEELPETTASEPAEPKVDSSGPGGGKRITAQPPEEIRKLLWDDLFMESILGALPGVDLQDGKLQVALKDLRGSSPPHEKKEVSWEEEVD